MAVMHCLTGNYQAKSDWCGEPYQTKTVPHLSLRSDLITRRVAKKARRFSTLMLDIVLCHKRLEHFANRKTNEIQR